MRRAITVSRGSYDTAEIVVAKIKDGAFEGRGECCPIAHYGWSADEVLLEIEAFAGSCSALSRAGLLASMPAGPARNAIDCALWDLETARSGRSAWELAGLVPPDRQATAMTIVLASPEDMAEQARAFADFQLLKLKLNADEPAEAIRMVRAARPDAILTVDANEGWSVAELEALYRVFEDERVALVEQPLPAGSDEELERSTCPVPICADESFHSTADLEAAARKYQYVNIKLDKCGGLTEALRIVEMAPGYGLRCMVGCMFATSLAIAPALLIAGRCDFADLDGPLHLREDRGLDGFRIQNGEYLTGSSRIWGAGSKVAHDDEQ
jgi:L-alanine-DL-glutamate epimerase-like enolase superfamily enzyme